MSWWGGDRNRPREGQLSEERIKEIERKIGYKEIKYTGRYMTDRSCARCNNTIWEGGGLFFRPRNKTQWMVFCRVDCASLAIGEDNCLKLLTLEKYIDKIMMEKPK